MNATNKRILVIDDNPEVREDFRRILDPPGRAEPEEAIDRILPGGQGLLTPECYQLDTAADGSDGLDIVRGARHRNEPFAVAFVDFRMPPGPDGIETIRNLWKIDPDLQTVLLTTHTQLSIQRILDELGASDKLLILKKPYHLAEICLLARTLTGKWASNREMSRTLRDLERAHDSLGEFLHFVSRDLKAPLHHLVNQAESLQGVIATGELRPLASTVETIGSLTRRVDSLIDALLEYARLTHYNFEVETVNLGELVREAAEILQLGGEPIGDRVRILPHPPDLRCHRSLIREVFMHLISNGLRYNDSGEKRVEVGSRLLPPPTGLEGDLRPMFEITVRDNGRGIPAELREQLFEFRASLEAETPGEDGYRPRIGLSMVRKIIELHQGEIRIESEPGGGTTISFTLGPDAFVEPEPVGVANPEFSRRCTS